MRKSAFLFSTFIVLAVLILTGTFAAFAEEQAVQPMVTAIEIKGLKRIEQGALKSKITQKVGEPFSNEATTNDIKNIYKMGYFDDVKVEVEPFEGGLKLIYLVKEKPTIVRVEFQGNKEFDDSKLKEKITITPNSIADTVLIQDNADKLRSFYEGEGYWLSRIVPVLKKISEDEVSLTYQIDEGSKVRIKNIIIEGAKVIPARKIKKAMKTGEWWILSFVTSSGYYKKETMDSDIEKIRELYFNDGYIKSTVGDPKIKLTDDRKSMIITIPVSEGDQYRISSIEITGNKAFTDEEIRKKLQLSPKSIFSREVVKKDVASITDMYSDKGYALISVFPDLVPDDASKQVKMVLKIDEGSIYKIGKIDISGNIKTKDKVIRREVRLDEGETFNGSALKRSYERINNLNFFDSVEMQPKPRPEEKIVDIDVKVKEKATGFFSIGGGYSSVDKLIGTIDLTQANLFGTGKYMKLRAELGGRGQYYEISYRDPWFMDKPLSFGADVYNTTRTFGEYKRKATGFDVSFGKVLSEYWRSDITYNFEKARIYDIATDASSTIKDQEGTRTTSSITPSITRDSRDNFLDAHKGSRNTLFVTYAGLGGTNRFVKSVVDSLWFFPLGDTTFSLRGRYGYASGSPLPLYERFYVGGIDTVRGLGFGQGGPRDENGDVIGGSREVIFNAEFIFPIISEMRLKGVVFFDAGKAYDSSVFNTGGLRYTSGAGVRWISPMGPIRVEWGYNLAKKHNESTSRWEFTFGSYF